VRATLGLECRESIGSEVARSRRFRVSCKAVTTAGGPKDYDERDQEGNGREEAAHGLPVIDAPTLAISPNGGEDRPLPRLALWIDVALKAALVGLLLFALARQDLPQFHGKAIAGRAIAYPVAVMIVPVIWWTISRRRRIEYPYALDILWTLPFLIDVAGNAANLYDTIDWWDDLNHFVNWGILVAAFGQLLVRLPVRRLEAAGLAIGFGAVTAVLWEFGEYVTFIRNNENELRTAYTDTLGDLALGLSGSVVAAVVTVTLLWHVNPSVSRAAAR